MNRVSPLLRRIISSIIVATSMQNIRAAIEALEEALKTEKHTAIEFISEWAKRNEVQYYFYTLAKSIPLSYSRELAQKLEKDAEKTVAQAKHVAEIIAAIRRALEENNIPYTVFKTFNKIGRVDVDIDIVVRKRDYWLALKHLHKLGLKPVDSVKKTYATGMAKPGNPIILDIHTEITALGMPYLDSSILLENSKPTLQILPGNIQVEARTATPIADTVARIAHAIIKEAEIRIDDITETLPVVTKKAETIKKIMRKEGIIPAYNAYLEAVAKALKTGTIPLQLKRTISLKLLIERATARKELYKLLVSMTNIKYPRNAAHLARLALRGLVKGV